jgi:hypothetical protein
MTALRETALAAIATRLTAQIPTATVERARRAPVDVTKERLPRLVVTGGDLAADESNEPGMTHYTLDFAVTGHATARTDLALEQALSDLQAKVTAALAGWQPATDNIGNTTEQGAEFVIADAEESAVPAGMVVCRFSILLIAATGNPFV